MSSNNVDNRVVHMQFDNAQFEAGVKQTLASLEDLKQGLKFNTSLTGINAVSNAINAFSLHNIADNVDFLASKFTVFGQIGQNVLANITNSAIGFGKQIYNSTVGVITSGGWNRAARSAQARFTLEGILGTDEKGLARVQQAFDSASESVNDTAYTLDQAVTVASQLVASGVDEGEELQKVLSGVAGVAATTGQSYEGLGHIWTTVAGNGRLMGIQLTQLSSYGLNAAQTLAKYLNKTESEIRAMTSRGEISFEMFSEAMAETFGSHAKDANKTFSGVTANIRAQLTKIGEIFSAGIIENQDLISFLNVFMQKIKDIKNYVEKLREPFKKLVSIVSKLAEKWVGVINVTGIDKFIGYVQKGIEYLSDILEKYIEVGDAVEDKVANSAIGAAVQDMADAAEKLEKAKEIWFKGRYGSGQERRDALGEQYEDVQKLVNAFYESGYSWEAVEEMIATSSTETMQEVADSTQQAGDAIEETEEKYDNFTSVISGLLNGFKKFGSGLKIIFNNIKMTIVKLAKSFTKVFSWKDLIQDISDYGDLFSEFVGKFEIGEDRAEKLERAFTGLWSAIDLLRMGIKFLITAGLKILGPVLKVVYDVILDVSAVVGDAISWLDKWIRKHGKLTETVGKFGELLGKTIETVVTFFKKLWNLEAVQKIRDKLWDLAVLIYDTLKPYFEKAADAVQGFLDKFNESPNNGNMEKILDSINGALENIITFSSDAKTAIGDFGNYIFEKGKDILGFGENTENAEAKMKKLGKTGKKIATSKNFGDFLSNIQDGVKTLGGDVDKVVDWIIKKFNSLDGATLALAGFGTGVTAFGLSLSYLSYNLGIFFKALASFPLEITKTFSQIKFLIKDVGKYLRNDSQAKVIKSFAIAIAVLAASFFLLTNYTNVDDLERVMTGMSLLLGIMAIMLIVMNYMSSKMFNKPNYYKSLSSMALMFVAIASAAFILSIALKELTTITWDKEILYPIGALAGILVVLVGLSALFTKIQGGFSFAALNVLLLSVALLVVVEALDNLATVDVIGLETKVDSLMKVIAILGVAAFLMSHFSFANSLGILVLIGSIWLVEMALQYVIDNGVSMDDIKRDADKFVPVLISLVIIAGFMFIVGLASKKSTHMALNIIAMAGAVYIIIKALQEICNIGLWPLIKGTAVICIILYSIKDIISELGDSGTYANKAGSHLLKIAGAMAIMAAVVAIMGHLPLPVLGKGMFVVGYFAGLVTLFIAVSQDAKEIDYKALYAMVVAIGIMSLCAALMSKIEDRFALWESMGILALGLMAFGAAMYLASRWGNRINVKAIVAMMAVLVLIAGSLYLLSTEVKDENMLLTSMAAMAAILLSLGYTLKLINEALIGKKYDKSQFGMVILVIAMLGVIATALYFVAQNDWQSTAVAGIAMIAVMGVVVMLIERLSETVSKGNINADVWKTLGASILLLVAVAGSMALILYAAKGSSFEKILAASMALIGTLIVVVGLMGVLGQNSNKFTINSLIGVLAACAILVAISYSLKEVLGTGANWKEMWTAAKSMALVFGVISIAMAILVGIASGTGWVGIVAALAVFGGMALVLYALSKAFTAFGKASKDVVSALDALTKVDFEKLDSATGTLFKMVGIIAAAILVCFVAGPAFVVLAGGVIALAVAIGALGVGLTILALPLMIITSLAVKLMNAISKLALVFATTKNALSEGIASIGTGLANGIKNFVHTLSSNSTQMLADITLFIYNVTSVITNGINAITLAILNGIVGFLDILEDKAPTIVEKTLNILIESMKVLAAKADALGYYSTIIAVKFIYGLAQGFYEAAPMLGEAVGNIIVGIFNMFTSLVETILPTLKDAIYKGVLNLSEALWGVLAETGWDFAEQQYETVVGEQEQIAAEKSEKIADAAAEGYKKGTDNNSASVNSVSQDVYGGATDQSGLAATNGTNTANAGINSFITQMQNGKAGLGEMANGVIGEIADGVDVSKFGDAGSYAMNAFGQGAENQAEPLKYKMSDLSSQAIDAMKAEGFKEQGEYLVKDIQTGMDESDGINFLNVNYNDEELMGNFQDTSDKIVEKAVATGEDYVDGLIKGAGNKRDELVEYYAKIASDADAAARSEDGFNERSPSKKGIEAGEYYGIGLGIGINNMANYVTTSASGLANSAVVAASEMMGTIASVLDEDNVDWTPTITPVIDSSQLQNGSNLINGTFDNSALSMAANASLSVSNSSQASLAQQVQNLSEQVKKLAETDYSEMLSGVAVNVDASTNVDGTPLRRTSAAFTIQQIDDQQRSYGLAMGGRA